MWFIQQLFTEEFWDNRVARFGSEPLTVARVVGVRKRIDYTEGDFDDLESPRVKRRAISDALGQRLVDDPEDFEPDAWHPGVEEGILYTDGATDWDREELDVVSGRKLDDVARGVGLKFSVKPVRQRTNCIMS